MSSPTNEIQEISMNDTIYRYMPFKRIECILKKKVNTLVMPNKFLDPLEKEYMKVLNKNFNENLNNIFVQCWTSEHYSDAMWQIYSRRPENPGVRIRMKVRNIVKPLEGKVKYRIGKVKYLSMASFKRRRDSIAEHKKTLMFKHSAFRYEKEIRLICWECRPNNNGMYCYKIDPNDVIEQIMIDPNANECQYEVLKKKLEDEGFPEQKIESSIRFRERALSS